MTNQPSLKGRALLAIVLLIGFYVLAIGIALGLLWVPYAVVMYSRVSGASLKLVIVCLISGLAILWSILPRRDKFVAPGPRLEPGQHPRLFEQLNAVASSTGQAMPSDVYLVGDVNAWVSQRGGVMGFGSSRVMGLGLPLLRALKVSELRAVVAHEFGHYHGGDTSLGPWIHKTRAAIGRTLNNLADSWVQKPFQWYGMMFLRITHAVSRQQEYAADALAARVAGAPALKSALQKIYGAALAFDAYWKAEFSAVLQAGYHAPIADGFGQFLSAKSVAASLTQVIDQELQEGKSDPYDTHPPLRERVAALAQLPGASSPDDEPSAITLIDDVPAMERSLLAVLGGAALAGKLKTLDWNDAGPTVYLPLWKQEAQKHSSALASIAAVDLPFLAKNPEQLRRHFQKVADRRLSDDELAQAAGAAIGCTLAVILAGKGCTMNCEVGTPISFARGDVRIEPFSLFADLRSGKLTPATWQTQCAATDLSDLKLVQEATQSAKLGTL